MPCVFFSAQSLFGFPILTFEGNGDCGTDRNYMVGTCGRRGRQALGCVWAGRQEHEGVQDVCVLFEVVLVYKWTQIVPDFFNDRGKYVYLNVLRSLGSLDSPSIYLLLYEPLLNLQFNSVKFIHTAVMLSLFTQL